MQDIYQHAASVFIIGSNTTEQHPVFGAMLRQAVLRRNVPLIVADPRKIEITEFARLHLQHNPGTDIALLNGIMNVILAHGWQDSEFISKRTENFDTFAEVIQQYPPSRVAEITGVSEKLQVDAARLLAENHPTAVIWAMGITQHTTGVANVLALANLQMLLGNIGIPGGGVNPLRGQNNVQGACDMGGLPNVYPGYQPVSNDAARQKFEAAWGIPLLPHNGITVTELVSAAESGAIKAMYILGENPALSDPDSNHVRRCLEACELIILQEIFPSETSAYADILLPGVSFAEKDGTFTNTERRIQMVNKAVEPPGDARQDWQIIRELALEVSRQSHREPAHAEWSGWEYSHPADIMKEIAALTPIYAGVHYSRLAGGATLQWPVPSYDHPGTPILHTEKFSRGKGLFSAVEHIPPHELPDKDYPWILNTGRVLYHWHGGEMTRRSAGLLSIYNESLVEINPEDADRLLLSSGDKVRVSSRRGCVEAKSWITDRVPPGMVYANFHFPEVPINELTIAALDPVAKIPEYKVCAVKIEHAD
jgi:predicted molibdopterin-dependent oxidoreductase YjgC